MIDGRPLASCCMQTSGSHAVSANPYSRRRRRLNPERARHRENWTDVAMRLTRDSDGLATLNCVGACPPTDFAELRDLPHLHEQVVNSRLGNFS